MDSVRDIIAELTEGCGLGAPEGAISPVSGGLMHRMYRVVTRAGVYAVKLLSPEIMARPDAPGNFARAERLEAVLEENGIPIVPALSFGGRKMQTVRGLCFYVFRWQEGCVTDEDSITPEQCFMAGELLGRIHAVDARSGGAPAAAPFGTDLPARIREAARQGCGAADILTGSLSLLMSAQSKLNEARTELPAVSCICDDDMDPKNVMWHLGKPYVIDLECLDRGNPYAGCVELSMQWSGTLRRSFDMDGLVSFYRGYLGAFDLGYRSFDKLYGLSYAGLEWLDYNIGRALGTAGEDAASRRLGESEIVRTVDRIRCLDEIEPAVRRILKSL